MRPPPAIAIAIFWLLAMLIVALTAPLITPYSFLSLDLRSRLCWSWRIFRPAFRF